MSKPWESWLKNLGCADLTAYFKDDSQSCNIWFKFTGSCLISKSSLDLSWLGWWNSRILNII